MQDGGTVLPLATPDNPRREDRELVLFATAEPGAGRGGGEEDELAVFAPRVVGGGQREHGAAVLHAEGDERLGRRTRRAVLPRARGGGRAGAGQAESRG